MDLSALREVDRTQSSRTHAHSQTGALDGSLTDRPNKGTLCASHQPAEPLPLDDSAEHGCDVSQSSSLNSESAPEAALRLRGGSDPSLPPLPRLPLDPVSLLSENVSGMCTRGEAGRSVPLIQNKNPSQPSSSVAELLFNHRFSSQHDQATSLMRPLTPPSGGLETDPAPAPASDLYIFESDTQDFSLSPSVAPQEIKCPEYQPLSQNREEETGGDSSKSFVMCDSAELEARYRHDWFQEPSRAEGDSDVIQPSGLRPPAVDACDGVSVPVSDELRGEAEVAGSTPQPWRSDSPFEMWQDACQDLAGEDIKDQDVPDKRGRSMMQGGLSAIADLSFLPAKTQVSVYNPEVGDWIGWSSETTRGPSFQRWSSVDSWASALSDWTEIITAPQDDITAAFTEIGAEIEALTQALAEVDTPVDPETYAQSDDTAKAQSQTPMVVQGRPLEVHDVPLSSGLSERQSVEPCVLPLTGRRETGPQEIQSRQAELSVTDRHRPMGSSDATLASCRTYDVDRTSSTPAYGSASYGNHGISQLDGDVETLDTDVFIASDEEQIVLNITEDADWEEQKLPAEILHGKPLWDGLREAAGGRRVSQQRSLTEQEAQRLLGPVEVYAEGSSPDLFFHTSDSPTRAEPSLHVTVSAACSIPDLQGARLLEPHGGSPEFISPIAALSVGSSFICQTTSDLEGDQLWPKRSLNDNRDLSWDHVQPCALQPASDGITLKTSLEGDDELLGKKANAVEAPPEGRLSFVSEGELSIEDIHELSKELSNLGAVPSDHFVISEEKHVAFITLELNDPFISWAPKLITSDQRLGLNQETDEEMPHKTHKHASESRTRSKKDKAGGHHHGPQVSKKQDSPHVPAQQPCNEQDARPHSKEKAPAGLEDREKNSTREADAAAEAAQSKQHGKKKKKQSQNAAAPVESGAKPTSAKGRIEIFEAKLGDKAEKDRGQADVAESKTQQPEGQQPPDQPQSCSSSLKDDVVKRRRLSGDKFGKIVSVLESKAPKTEVSVKAKGEEPKSEAGATRRKAYSEAVKQKTPTKEGKTSAVTSVLQSTISAELQVVQPIQAASVSGDPQSLSLWCQFAGVSSDHSVTWSRDGAALAESKRSAGDERRVSLTVSNASHKDLGKYQCRLSSPHGSVTLDYVLTYEVLSEIVIPPSPKTVPTALVQVSSEEEDVHCSSLMFKEDFLSDQYFGENRPVCIITEKSHFGEGMHRRAFRTKLQAGHMPLLVPGHSCVLKVHNSISYGTKNNDELVQKNFSLAVEECQVQNTARQYIKAYTAVAQSLEAFGEVPEIIPIYLVHRPSNDIPYATLEEELIGDFVKYSVKDGKEINLMRRDSEAGQKCCAFQHWVYQTTEGNLLVTDMQGVGMRLTDVGIATCKKGYKGFKGNCATSFIDQFKALHQCNRYCEILELQSLQPKAKKPASAPKPRPQPPAAPKKKTLGPTVKGKT